MGAVKATPCFDDQDGIDQNELAFGIRKIIAVPELRLIAKPLRLNLITINPLRLGCLCEQTTRQQQQSTLNKNRAESLT